MPMVQRLTYSEFDNMFATAKLFANIYAMTIFDGLNNFRLFIAIAKFDELFCDTMWSADMACLRLCLPIVK